MAHPMIPLSPALLIATANAFVGMVEERDEGSARRAPTRAPWHTAFVQHVGYWSHYDQQFLRSSWPLLRTADCNELAAFALEQQVLASQPMTGDVFLLWSPRTLRFVRTGIVVSVEDEGRSRGNAPWYECHTIEGDTDQSMAQYGGMTLRHLRRLSAASGDRFVRWTALDGREERSVVPVSDAAQLMADGAREGQMPTIVLRRAA